jgi:hypothetical protein
LYNHLLYFMSLHNFLLYFCVLFHVLSTAVQLIHLLFVDKGRNLKLYQEAQTNGTNDVRVHVECFVYEIRKGVGSSKRKMKGQIR